jgi:methyl-accepting chemotaxis protein
MGTIQDHLDTIVDVNVRDLNILQSMSESAHVLAEGVSTLVLLQDEADMVPQVKKIADTQARYDRAFGALTGNATDSGSRSLQEKIRVARAQAMVPMDKAIELAKRNEDAAATALLMKDAGPAMQRWLDAIDKNIDFQKATNKKDAQASHAAYDHARLLMGVLTAAALGLGIVIAWLISRSITVPIGRAVRIAETVASGDLTSQFKVDTKDETGRLLAALAEMNGNLSKMVGDVRVGTETIATASRQIASGNLDLSSRTEQQAASLEETAASMEELTATVKQNSENAREANKLAAHASDAAVQGGSAVRRVVDTMEAINASASKIVDIIGVIDGIAFQTNILALNAAVEAARAGEQGRGFAVVASEVRNLAQRSAVAAKEIKVLINDSAEKIDAGGRLVREAGTTINEMVESVKRVTDIMGEIMGASDEQYTGIEQVNQAISQMDQVTQQNAALVEESAAAAASLQEQADYLVHSVGVFRLSGGEAVALAAYRDPAATSGRTPVRGVPRHLALASAIDVSN